MYWALPFMPCNSAFARARSGLKTPRFLNMYQQFSKGFCGCALEDLVKLNESFKELNQAKQCLSGRASRIVCGHLPAVSTVNSMTRFTSGKTIYNTCKTSTTAWHSSGVASNRIVLALTLVIELSDLRLIM